MGNLTEAQAKTLAALAPGKSLNLDEITASTQMARVRVRDAVSRLSGLGMVRFIRRGTGCGVESAWQITDYGILVVGTRQVTFWTSEVGKGGERGS